MSSIRTLFLDDSGATAIEYALIASLIAIVIVTALQLVGTQMTTVFGEVSNALK
jgi:pilus assembly protein Flp/PilA